MDGESREGFEARRAKHHKDFATSQQLQATEAKALISASDFGRNEQALNALQS
jgi:hypothetical protein